MSFGTSKVSICNMALSQIGAESQIEDINEASVPARTCRLWYEQARRATLERFNWTFARRRQELALHSVPPAKVRYLYRYQYPENCLVPRFIENSPLCDPVSFQVEEAGDQSLSILSSKKDAVLIYTFNQENINLFSSHFELMMSVRLALFINVEITGENRISERLYRRFQDLLLEAPTVDADSEMPMPDRDPAWIVARQ